MKFRGYTALTLFSLLAVLSGCSDSCSQDSSDPFPLDTNENPYQYVSHSSDLDIESARWVNETNGSSGDGTVTIVNDCLFLLGCGQWARTEMSIDLNPGLNRVSIYETEDGCEWREDYDITLN